VKDSLLLEDEGVEDSLLPVDKGVKDSLLYLRIRVCRTACYT
jgi:hypothetical protein